MKRIFALALAAGLLAFPALAQDPPPPSPAFTTPSATTSALPSRCLGSAASRAGGRA